MAWTEKRTQGNLVNWRVVWTQTGLATRQQETFNDEVSAREFEALVEASKNRWPHGWIKGVGFTPLSASDAPRFRDYAEKTIAARPRADERTKADYRAMLRNHVFPHIGDLPVDRIDRFHVAAIADRITAAGKSAKTVENVHAMLSSILRDAVTDGHMPRNVAVGAMPVLPDVRTEEMAFLTPGEFSTLHGHIEAGPYRDLARLLVGTGLRWSEATALQVHDVDLLGRKVLHVRRAWKRRDGLFILGAPKTNRSRRSVSLSPELVDLLVQYVSARNPGEFLFTTKQGRPVRHSNFYNRMWRPAVARAMRCAAHVDAERPCGCPGTLTKQPRIHDLRHTHASWLIDQKISLPAIQRRLGHESIQTTIDRYGHLAPEHVDEINAAVDKALGADVVRLPDLSG